MLQVQNVVCLDALVGGVVEHAVVEDLAVLVDLDESRPAVGRGAAEGFRQVVDVHVNRPGHEGRLSADGQRQGPQGIVDGAKRTRFGPSADPGCRRVLSLGQAINLVIEQDNLQIDIAANGVDQVVAANRESVAVAGYDPDI